MENAEQNPAIHDFHRLQLAALDLDQTVELLAKREEKLRSQGKDPRAKKKTRRKK